MKYRIHNIKNIKSKDNRKSAKKIIEKQMSRLNRIAENYPKPLIVDIHFRLNDKVNYLVSAVIKLKENLLYVKERGDNIEAILHLLFDRLKVSLSKKISKEKKVHQRRRTNKNFEIFNENINELQELKTKENKETFNELLKLLLNDVAKYFRRRIKAAEMTTAIKKGKFKVQELLDELYIIIYDRFEEIPKNNNKTNIWLYQLADELLIKHFQEINFEKEHFERIEGIIDAEYESLKEVYAVDAEEEIIPIEELDEYERLGDSYSANDLFYEEDENTLLDDITLKFNEKEIHNIIKIELAKLPLIKRTIMDLFLINQMTVHEIASIKDISETEVEAVIHEVSKDLKRKLSFLI